MATEAKVAGHYRRGQLEETIFRAMAQMGKDTAHLVAADLAPIGTSEAKRGQPTSTHPGGPKGELHRSDFLV
jgi:hypothetical protein